MRKVSMTARDELVNALARRYAVAGRAEKTRILDEFVAIAGFHREHAMRRLRCDAAARRSEGKASRRIYDEAVCEAIVVLWEASDRICGKRLKALMPVLVEAMERHGHLRLGPEIRAAVLAMSASTIDRSLREVREQASGRKRRRTAAPSSVRKRIPVRTFSDWDDPPPGFVEADLVAHCGPVANGRFVQMLTVTDIATGWTECAPLLYREQTLLREVLGEVRRRLPFELLGFDTDNDSVFVNETVRDYCRDSGIVFTRCRPWRKNDQAFVEQKNGAIVRRWSRRSMRLSIAVWTACAAAATTGSRGPWRCRCWPPTCIGWDNCCASASASDDDARPERLNPVMVPPRTARRATGTGGHARPPEIRADRCLSRRWRLGRTSNATAAADSGA